MNHINKNHHKFKLALTSYTSPNSHGGDQLKPKVSPLQIQKPANAHRNLQQKNNREKRILQASTLQSKGITSKCYELITLLQDEKTKYLKKQQTILQFIKSYYSQMKSIIAKWQQNSMQMVREQMDKLRQSIDVQKSKVINKLYNLQKKIHNEDIKLNLLNQITVPSFQIEGDCMGDFDRIVQKFKPIFVHVSNNRTYEETREIKISRIIHSNELKQNKQINQQKYTVINNDENTIKKQQNTQKLQLKNAQVCEFSCDQELSWSSVRYNDKKQNKHEIVSEIILEQPSSCEDSLIIHDGV